MRNKRINSLLLILLVFGLMFSACAGEQENSGESGDAAAYSTFNDIQADEDGNLIIPAEVIGSEARFFNYDSDGVTVQFVALRDNAGEVHVAFNTCQSCSPSPQAYYQQNGDVLQCTNCGFTFEPEEVGITQGGCNPWPVDGIIIGDDVVTIPAEAADEMRPAFENWGGPTD